MITYDYSKLRGRIVEKFGNQARFAKAIGLSPRTVTEKINNNSAFKTTDIEKCLPVLGIARKEIPDYFFAVKARKSEYSVES